MLSQVERGETSPTLAVAAKIAAGLELTLSQLLRLDEGEHVSCTITNDDVAPTLTLTKGLGVYCEVDHVLAYFDVLVWKDDVAAVGGSNFGDSVATDESARLELLEPRPG